jgi:hypothetical protein
MLIKKCNENGHDTTLFNTLRKRAVVGTGFHVKWGFLSKLE